MENGALEHNHVTYIQESKECSSYHYSNEHVEEECCFKKHNLKYLEKCLAKK